MQIHATRLRLLVCSLVAGLLSSPAAALAANPAPAAPPQKRSEGLTPGSDQPVDLHNGSFQHQIDVQVPDFHGITPSVSLSFNSAGGNGFAGVGWSLGGFSVIERVGAGAQGTRRCTSADAYTLDGEPLLACSALGGTHCTKKQSFRRIQFDATNQRWTVWDTNGNKLTYTKIFQIPASLPNSSCPYRYGLASVEDPLGNKVAYNWFDDSSVGETHKELYPASIVYNGVTITFYRETRPDPISYANGFDWTNQKFRLKTIAVAVNAAGVANSGAVQLLRAYKLGYAASPSGRSQLTSVGQYGRDATVDATGAVTAGGALSQQTFSYGGGSVGFTGGNISSADFSDSLGWSDATNYSTMRLVDLDGDGKLDVCGRSDAGIICRRQTGQGWEAFANINNSPGLTDAGGWNKPQYDSTIQFPDLNGDGRADLCARAASGVVCWFNTGSSPTFTAGPAMTGMSDANGWGGSAMYYSTIQFADINGDGKADLCGRDSSGVQCSLMNAAGTAFQTAFAGPRWSNAAGWNVPERYSTIQYPDINGDGKADVCGRSADGIRCYLSTGSGFDLSITWIGPAWSDANSWNQAKYYSTIQYPDINGDGKADVCGRASDGIHCHLAIGSARIPGDVTAYAFNTIAIIPPSGQTDANGYGDPIYYSTIQYPDINGDGRADLCWRDSAGINCDRSNGTSFTGAFRAAPAWSNASGWSDANNYATIRFADLDGDGKADLFGRANAGIAGSLTAHDGPERLIGITNNGLGGSVALTYAPSSTFANTNNPPIEQVVTAVDVNDGRGNVSRSTYSYSGGQFDRGEKRSLGFRYVARTLPAIAGETAALIEERWFMQAPYACVGELDYVKKSTGAGRLLTYSQRAYQAAGSGVGPFTCQLDQQSDLLYDPTGNTTCTAQDNAHCKRVDVNYDYDAYGNPTVVYEYGDYFDPADDTTKEIFYDVNAAAYIMNTPMVERLHPGIGTAAPMVQEKRTFYDGATAVDTPPVAGLPTMRQDWVSSLGGANPTPAYVTHRTGYDAYGNALWEEDAFGNRTTFVFDPVFNRFAIGTTNPLSQTSTTVWDTVCGLPLALTDLNGQVTSFQYDAFCRVARKDTPLGGFEVRSYSPLGDATAEWTRVETPPVAGIAGNVYQISYMDGLGRVYRTQARGPDPAVADDVLVDTTFDARGNERTRTVPRYETAPAAVMTFDHDELDRVLTATHADGSTVATAYNLWTTFTTDEVGRQVARTVDARGLLTVVAELDGTTWNLAQFSYDVLGNPIRVVDPAGNSSTYAFNSLGQKLTQSDPDLGPSSFTYDAAGRRLTETDARGQRTELAYDPLGRVTTKRLGAESSQPAIVSYGYDEPRSGFFNVGRATSMTDAAGAASYDFDAAGRLARETRSVGGTIYTFQRAYDPAGRLTGVRYPDGDSIGDDPATSAAETALGYDAAGRLRSIPGIADNVTYHAAGPISSIANPNGTTSTRSLSPTRSWLDAIRTTRGTASIQDVSYGRDAAGKITAITSPLAGDGWSYGYDSQGRLARATRTSGAAEEQTFNYDSLGNILLNSRLGLYTYPPPGAPGPHAVAVAGNLSFRYDAAGNMLEGNGRVYTWDAVNRLASVTMGANVSSFVYDGNGARLEKRYNGAATRYLGDDYEIAPDGTVTKYFRLGMELAAKKVGAARFWMHANHIDTVAVMTDETGNEVKRDGYRAYGEHLDGTGSQRDPRGFTGQPADETGLIYLHARYYDPVIARFLSPDSETPDDLIIALNRYAYGNDDPVNYFDPTGHFSWKKLLFTAAVVVVAGGLCATGVGCAIVVGAAAFGSGVAYDTVVDHKSLKDPRMWAENAIDGITTGLCAGLCRAGAVADRLADGLLGPAYKGAQKLVEDGVPYLNRAMGRAMGLDSAGRAALNAGRGAAVDAAAARVAMTGVNHAVVNFSAEHAFEGLIGHGTGTLINSNLEAAEHRAGERTPVAPTPHPSGPFIPPNPYYNPTPSPTPSPPVVSRGCFVAGTHVTMADGTQVPIERIRVGERVLAFDESTGRLVPALVTQLFVHPHWTDQATTILINGRLRATTNHPFFVNGQWHRAEDIRPGDLLRTLTPAVTDLGSARSTVSEAVQALAPMAGVDTVYNLEVDRYHTYFAEGVLVHNRFLKD